MAYEEETKTEWNFDGAEAEAIFSLKANFILQLASWDLEGAFWTLRTLRMELDAKLVRGKKKLIEEMEAGILQEGKKVKAIKIKTEKEEVDALMLILENERNTFRNSNINDDRVKTRFFSVLENFYMHLCHLMKKHGLYFREKEYGGLAVTKR